MACPEDSTWVQLVDGGLDAASIDVLEQHLDACAACRFLFANLARRAAPPGIDDGPTEREEEPTGRARPALKRPLPVPFSSPPELVRGALVGRYVILGTLGRGGMGVVYKAFDPELDRPIALKLVLMRELGLSSEDARARLLREAKTLAQLSHPNVVAVYDVGSHEDDVFVAMEFVAGTTLRKWLAEKPRAPRDVLRVFRAAGTGLAAAHRAGIVHRDFKPENVMIGDDGRVRVLDFGLARPPVQPVARPSLPIVAEHATDTTLTQAGAIMGTPAYMAPEQDRGDPVDAKTDQFSFCASLYEALYGQRPFPGEAHEVMRQHRLVGDVRVPPSRRGVSARVRRATLRGLRVDPAERHPSMGALLRELGDGRASRRTILAAAAGLGAVSITIGAWGVWAATNAAPSADEACATSTRTVELVWNAPRRDQILSRFRAVSGDDGVQRARRVLATIEAYVDSWRAHRMALCKESLTTAPGAESHLPSEVQCLRAQLALVDGQLEAMGFASTPAMIARAEARLSELTPLDRCRGRGQQLVAVDDRSTPILQTIVAADVALTVNLDEAERLARDALAQQSDETDPALRAMTLLTLGAALARKGEVAEARTSLLGAIRAATITRDEVLVVRGWNEILSLVFSDRRMLPELDDELFAAEVAALRLPPTDALYLQIQYSIGTIEVIRGNHDAAKVHLERARAGLDPAQNAAELANVTTSLAVIDLHRGAYESAARGFEQVAARYRDMPGASANLGLAMSWQGEVHAFQHAFSPAVAAFEQAVATFEGAGLRHLLPKAQFQLGYAHARAGDCTRAVPLFAEARAVAQELGKQDVVSLALLGLGHCKLAAGDARGAVALLDQALTLARELPSTLWHVPMVELTLARALSSSDVARSRTLATQARDGFARFAGLAKDQAAAEVLLATP